MCLSLKDVRMFECLLNEGVKLWGLLCVYCVMFSPINGVGLHVVLWFVGGV